MTIESEKGGYLTIVLANIHGNTFVCLHILFVDCLLITMASDAGDP